jgi:periplasmic protein TonB
MNLRSFLSWTVLVGASLGMHAVGFAKLGTFTVAATSKRPPTPSFMEMAAAPRPAPAAQPEVAQEKPAPKAVRRVAAVAAPRPAPASAPRAASAAPPPVAETPADFSGTTLTNNGPGPGWASATGNGAAMQGPIGRPGARVTGRHVEASPPSTQPGPAVVAVADLSRLPQAPKLDEALERNYPAEARRIGQAGKAVVRARITPDGRVRDLQVISESASGFGRACQDVLVDSRWSPPFDREGHPVATVIHYTCRFEVR